MGLLGKGEAGIQSPTITPGRLNCLPGRVEVLTRWEATTKEHVEKVFGGDVSLKAAVEVPVSVARLGCLGPVMAELGILLSLLWVAKYCICCADGWKGGRKVRPEDTGDGGVLGSQGLTSFRY